MSQLYNIEPDYEKFKDIDEQFHMEAVDINQFNGTELEEHPQVRRNLKDVQIECNESNRCRARWIREQFSIKSEKLHHLMSQVVKNMSEETYSTYSNGTHTVSCTIGCTCYGEYMSTSKEATGVFYTEAREIAHWETLYSLSNALKEKWGYYVFDTKNDHE